MGRRRKDKKREAAIEKLSKAVKTRDFIEQFEFLQTSWKARDCPSIWDDREVSWDEVHRQSSYRGLYYDLRELCDRFDLPWPHSGEIIVQLFHGQESGEVIQEPPECPPQEQWAAWRMARTEIGGVGLPRSPELSKVHEIVGHEGESEDGLTRTAITYLSPQKQGKQEYVDPKTVSNWIENCWAYLLKGGDLNRAAEMAELTGEEMILVLVKLMQRRVEK